MTSRRKRIHVIVAVLVLLVLATTVTVAAPDQVLVRRVLGGGGGLFSAPGGTLRATLGQPLTGLHSSGPGDLCTGFWCGLGRYEVVLPLVLKS